MDENLRTFLQHHSNIKIFAVFEKNKAEHLHTYCTVKCVCA